MPAKDRNYTSLARSSQTKCNPNFRGRTRQKAGKYPEQNITLSSSSSSAIDIGLRALMKRIGDDS